MAILHSDTFNGMTASAAIAGRTLDNGLGGSGTLTWDSAGGGLRSNGAGGIEAVNSAHYGIVSLGGPVDVDLRVRLALGATTNVGVMGRRSPAGTSSPSFVAALWVSSGSLRVRESVSGTSNDRAQKSVAQITGAPCYLGLKLNGLSWTAYVLDEDEVPVDSVSYTASSGPTGEFYGFGLFGSGTNVVFDDWLVQSIDAPPPSIVRPRGGFIL